MKKYTNSYLYLKIENFELEKLIQKLAQINVQIHDININENTIFFKVSVKDYEKIKKYLKYLNIKKEKYLGIAGLKSKIKKYKLSFIGILSSIVFIIVMSYLIVDIKVIHEDSHIVQIINNELENYGIKKFTFAKSYQKINKIKMEIKEKHLDLIDWLEISKEGMRYVIRVEERIITNVKTPNKYCTIVASKDGLIKKISVLKGEQKIQTNDYVKKGDILISGDITLNENSVNRTCADGSVYAEVWYQVDVSVPLVYYDKIPTGKKRSNIIINYNNIDHVLFKNRITNYESENKVIFDSLGIKISLRQDSEVKKKQKIYTESQAIQVGLKQAGEKIKLRLEKEEYIIDEKVLQKEVNNSTINLDIFIVALENIAEKIVLKEESSDGI